MSPRLILTIAAGLILSSLPIQAQQTKDDPNDLSRWIKQLGSSRFREREAAANSLSKQRSPQALAHLRQAARTGDADVRKRAREILDAIERLLETEQVLQPFKLRLDFKDIPIADAVADFGRRSGLKLVLADNDKQKLANRKVTVSTGEVGVWEALRQLCHAAGLNERPPYPATKQVYDHYEELRGGRRMVWMRHGPYSQPVEESIILGDGGVARPLYLAGSLRIGVLPRPPLVGPPARTAELTLAVDVEPRYTWGRLVSIRIDEAIDDRGQKLVRPVLIVGELPQQQPADELLILWSSDLDLPRTSSREGTVKMKLGAKLARTIKEMRGRLAAEVEAPPAPLITVTDVLNAGGKTFSGPDGSQLRMIEAKRDEAGQYRIQVEVRLAPPKQQPFAGNIIWLNPGPVAAGGTTDLTAAELEQRGLSLYDAQGQPFLLATAHYNNPAKPHDPLTYTLYYQPRKDQGDPVRFLLTGKRHVLLEVPFVLKDVPLP